MSAQFLPVGWPESSDWTSRLESHFSDDGFQALCKFVEQERATQTIFPAPEDVFTAFETPFAETKVVILGQDPYHGPGQAHGLSFSVRDSISEDGQLLPTKLPPSLKNIFKELASDLGGDWDGLPASGDLTSWAQQGVFLLNTVLTVRSGEANSHRKRGWEKFTDHVIVQLNQRTQGLVFILWGKPAEKKTKLIDSDRHAVITSAHPSPLSAHRGFFGSKPFSRCNEALTQFGHPEILWNTPTAYCAENSRLKMGNTDS